MFRTHQWFATPHLWGRLDYAEDDLLRPDGDTIHLRDVMLLHGGRRCRPHGGALEVTMPGHTRPRELTFRGGERPYLPIRLSGLDAPEAHYVASVRPDPTGPTYRMREGRHVQVCQPYHEPAYQYIRRVEARARYLLIEVDRDVTDRRGRVLGFVFASDEEANKKTFVSLELVRRGLAFPYVFESAADYRPRLLAAGAAARNKRLGVWARYSDAPMPYRDAAWAVLAAKSGIIPKGRLNHPMIFRRVVEAGQLHGFELNAALRKYDVIDNATGDLFPGHRYERVPVERRVWAPHRG
ncbi:MAG: hypothetical protein HOW73_18230 [Polyangiaceae bacterium]|nr:hypothetical protein [Polyangiaceae bacterium]